MTVPKFRPVLPPIAILLKILDRLLNEVVVVVTLDSASNDLGEEELLVGATTESLRG